MKSYDYLESFAAIFVASDAQTTFLAIVLTGSICCSIIWMLFNLFSSSSPTIVASSAVTISRDIRPSDKLGNLSVRRKNSNRSLFYSGTSNFQSSTNSSLCFKTSKRKLSKTTSEEYSTNQQKQENLYNGKLLCTMKPEEVDLSHNNLSRCPLRIGFLGSQLVSLDLSSNSLSDLPEEIGCLLGLERLLLGGNKLKSLPDTLQNLQNLHDLDVHQNRIAVLPETLSKLVKLKRLRLDNNRLGVLSARVGQLVGLEELDIGFNKLTELPDEICCLFNLTRLYISNNRIHHLPINIHRLIRLRELTATSCHLQSLPKSLARCQHLTHLSLSHNRLQCLPDCIGQLHNLQIFHLDNNRLVNLPMSVIWMNSCRFSFEWKPIHYLCMLFLSVEQNLFSAESFSEFNSAKHQAKQNPQGVVSLLHQSAEKILLHNIKWQCENLPDTLKELLNCVQFCICCDRPLFESSGQWMTRKHILVCLGGQSVQVLLVQRICPVQSRKHPCTFQF